MTLQAIKYERGRLQILDQLLLPDTSRYLPIHGTEDAWQAIKKMQVGSTLNLISPLALFV